MQMTQPTPISGKMPPSIAAIFANSQSQPGAIQPHGKPLKNTRGGTKILIKNPFQGAINNEALALRKY